MEGKKAAIFDFDDTLLSTFESRSPCLKRVAFGFGYNISISDIKIVWGLPFREMIMTLLPGINYEEFYRKYQIEMLRFPPLLKSGALELLRKLKSANHQILVFSSSSHDLIEQDLKATGVRGYIDNIWGHEDIPCSKPQRESLSPVLGYLEDNNIPIRNVFYIGDSTKDFKVARENRIRFFAVLSGADQSGDFIKLGLSSNLIFESLNVFPFPFQ